MAIRAFGAAALVVCCGSAVSPCLLARCSRSGVASPRPAMAAAFSRGVAPTPSNACRARKAAVVLATCGRRPRRRRRLHPAAMSSAAVVRGSRFPRAGVLPAARRGGGCCFAASRLFVVVRRSSISPSPGSSWAQRSPPRPWPPPSSPPVPGSTPERRLGGGRLVVADDDSHRPRPGCATACSSNDASVGRAARMSGGRFDFRGVERASRVGSAPGLGLFWSGPFEEMSRCSRVIDRSSFPFSPGALCERILADGPTDSILSPNGVLALVRAIRIDVADLLETLSKPAGRRRPSRSVEGIRRFIVPLPARLYRLAPACTGGTHNAVRILVTSARGVVHIDLSGATTILCELLVSQPAAMRAAPDPRDAGAGASTCPSLADPRIGSGERRYMTSGALRRLAIFGCLSGAEIRRRDLLHGARDLISVDTLRHRRLLRYAGARTALEDRLALREFASTAAYSTSPDAAGHAACSPVACRLTTAFATTSSSTSPGPEDPRTRFNARLWHGWRCSRTCCATRTASTRFDFRRDALVIQGRSRGGTVSATLRGLRALASGSKAIRGSASSLSHPQPHSPTLLRGVSRSALGDTDVATPTRDRRFSTLRSACSGQRIVVLTCPSLRSLSTRRGRHGIFLSRELSSPTLVRLPGACGGNGPGWNGREVDVPATILTWRLARRVLAGLPRAPQHGQDRGCPVTRNPTPSPIRWSDLTRSPKVGFDTSRARPEVTTSVRTRRE